ncbi:MAG: hypothetical protein IKU07_10380 [Oscillospiraceae bacterium]|nr:hypothetical protein [Oscillospiraceae bacterium]
MKRVLAFIISFCILFLLCACGGAGNSSATTEPAKGPLDGKKIIFIGNSHTYVGNVVSQVYNKNPRQEDRDHNIGLFYLLCNRLGSEVNVTNWTFSSHGLASIFGESCTTKGDCFGLDHKSYMTDRYFDYVVIQPGVGTSSEENIAEDIAMVVDFFKEANSNAKFVLLGNTSVYGNNKTDTPYPGITSYYKTLAEQGFIMADWGKLVNDLIHGIVTPEGSSVTYNKNCFIIKDGFHPNYLSGYIASIMTYCAITGTAAADIPADIFQDSAMVISLDSHLTKSYSNPEYDTNCKIILTTQSELEKIHLLIDKYLAEKPYLQN